MVCSDVFRAGAWSTCGYGRAISGLPPARELKSHRYFEFINIRSSTLCALVWGYLLEIPDELGAPAPLVAAAHRVFPVAGRRRRSEVPPCRPRPRTNLAFAWQARMTWSGGRYSANCSSCSRDGSLRREWACRGELPFACDGATRRIAPDHPFRTPVRAVQRFAFVREERACLRGMSLELRYSWLRPRTASRGSANFRESFVPAMKKTRSWGVQNQAERLAFPAALLEECPVHGAFG